MAERRTVILDAFAYAGEARMLDARLSELAGLVVPVAVMGNRTFQGDEQPYPETPEGVGRVEVDLSRFDGTGRGGQGSGHNFHRERFQRDASGEACASAVPGDVFMVSDVDEIPRRDALLAAVDRLDRCPTPVLALNLEMFVWGPRWVWPGPWLGPTLVRLIESPFGGAAMPPLSAQQMRDSRTTELCATVEQPDDWQGWHLSWWGGEFAARRKLSMFSHAELASAGQQIGRMATKGIDVNGNPLHAVPDWSERDWPGDLDPAEW